MSKANMVIPVFIPHKGCPFDCIYCNQKTISGQMEEMTVDKMVETVEEFLASGGKGRHIEIGFYGGSFTGIEKEQQIQFLEAAYRYVRDGRVNSIRLSTRPDYIDEDILEYLSLYGVGLVELGVQSFDREVLERSCRGHSAEDVIRACRLIKASGIGLGIQTMIGLPADTMEKDIETAWRVAELKPETIRIYPALVIRNTYLEKLYLTGKYTPLSLDDAVLISSKLLEIYRSAGLNVIRIGLQPTAEISENAEITAGPFHPAFRQLVESQLALEKLQKAIEIQNLQDKKMLMVRTSEHNISNITGQKGSNISKIKEKYNIGDIKIKKDNAIKTGFIVTYCE